MKPNDLADLMIKNIEFVEAYGGNAMALSFPQLLLQQSKDASVKAFVKKIGTLKFKETCSTETSLIETLKILKLLEDILICASAKAAASDVAALLLVLGKFENVSTVAILEAVKEMAAKKSAKTTSTIPVRQEIVDRYVRRLDEALGDDYGFNAIYQDLENDNEITSAEIIQLAKRFAFSGAKSKGPALKKIRGRHDALMTSRAKSASTAGRIAG